MGFQGRRTISLLMVGTMLAGVPVIASAQQRPARPAPVDLTTVPTPPRAAPTTGSTITSITVIGSQRIEPETVRSYLKLRPGGPYTQELGDEAIRDLFDTELFADAQIRDDNGALTILVRENPVINRIVFEGNKRLKEDKLSKELKLAPRQIFTRSKVRADIGRIVELYRRQGRFAATVEPKMVTLDQNRVDIVYEISEGPKSKVRRINIIGNEVFKDKKLKGEMATKESSITRIFSSRDTYDADRLAYDQGKLRQFYLTQGYADFRVISAVAELTPDKRDFILTYVVEEGPRYKFGDVLAESEIRDFKPEVIKAQLPMKTGDWYNAKAVEDTVENITKTAGLFGYAFANVDPVFNRNKEDKTMNITFRVGETPRVYVEAINVNGNTLTQDKVLRREFRLAEGDAFNAFSVKRSEDRIKSLGFFQEKFEIAQRQGSAPDRIVLEANVEEKSTGELQLSAGFSSLERFILNASIRQRNFRGKGQELRASVNYSTYSKSVELGFTEPYLFDRNIALGGDIFRRDYNSFNFVGNTRNTTYAQTTTGFQIRAGLPLTEYWSMALRYGLSFDEVSLDPNTYFYNGACDPLIAGRYLCDAIGNRSTSSVGYSIVFDSLNNRIRPSRGTRFVFSQDLAGLGGSVKYLRQTINAAKYWPVLGNFILSISAEAGSILPLTGTPANGADPVRLTDRFFLGEPQIRGFDIRGVGPRVLRVPYISTTDANGVVTTSLSTDRTQYGDDALGGRAYYMSRLELEIPLGSGAKELGLRPSIFLDAGAVFGVRTPTLTDTLGAPIVRDILDTSGNTQCINQTDSTLTVRPSTGCATGTIDYASSIPAFKEIFLGNSPRPRVSIGIGVNWNSPFGPFRIDLAKVLLKEEGDQTKTLTFNVGTQF
ncbi:outer membrane protein assembly factor BamA [Sphingomonas sp. SUN039]|uniref:outer membrane protein assembly factor BamA n=1 Tax=Sphingomonas sp. SUN039 TaxID=2937787 RepID=UPI0021646615|nr:outer membrane protein assembly factor BamA [Sphingomonas sp. SUN039]UVO53281.1 outer membrane protein assembly factor BamA [Sphingomonas sp. SUN039]